MALARPAIVASLSLTAGAEYQQNRQQADTDDRRHHRPAFEMNQESFPVQDQVDDTQNQKGNSHPFVKGFDSSGMEMKHHQNAGQSHDNEGQHQRGMQAGPDLFFIHYFCLLF
jgi:hypothetical protein